MRRCTQFLVPLLVALAPSAAWAHPGHDGSGFVDGIAHPLFGIDHLLVMVAVGLWAVQLGGRALWSVPAAFVAVMAGGAALALAGVALPAVEPGIAASVVVLGLLVALMPKVPSWLPVPLVGLFGLAHGYAHGAEMPAASQPMLYGLGFVLATVALHGAGMAAGLALQDKWGRRLVRALGAVVGLAGGYLAVAA